jgi:hypothetical protein
LKNYVTGDFITIEGKHMHSFQYENPLSFILLTNHDALCFEASERRNVCLDLSTERMGDHQHFSKLKVLQEKMRNSDPKVTNYVRNEIDALNEIDQANYFYMGAKKDYLEEKAEYKTS